jgi:glutamate-ammonia-ligase adenylyltransferase
MTFHDRISRLPIPHDPARGQVAVDLLGPLDDRLAELIRGAAGCSPYLSGLIQLEAGWLTAMLTQPDTEGVDIVQRETEGFDALSAEALGPALRRAKRRVALWTGLADLGGVWTLEQVTGALTRLADRATDLALRVHVAHEQARGKLPATP